MAKTPLTTRTIGPLHLEDLEPHRFEDLVRQLTYEFKDWLRLEATGRLGSDEGFDVRGLEITGYEERAAGDGSDEATAPITRPWLIQCKREKAISPKKLSEVMEGLGVSIKNERVYGLIFAAACDFSKLTRDSFYRKAGELGISEAHLWGKAEIEDALFQPKNDYLLFAYFGISLSARRRSQRAEVKAELAIKRKVRRLLQRHDWVMIKDVGDERYPYLDADTTRAPEDRGRWHVLEYIGAFWDGVRFRSRWNFAYHSADGNWDVSRAVNLARGGYRDPWSFDRGYEESKKLEWPLRRIWSSLPEHERARYCEDVVFPYSEIIDIDENGDDLFDGKHVLVDFAGRERGPASDVYCTLMVGNVSVDMPEASRIKFFPSEDELKNMDAAAVLPIDGLEIPD